MPPQLKPQHLRANRNKPTHGEYVTLAPLSAPVLPPLSDFGPAPAPLGMAYTGKWPRRTIAKWNSWRAHPITAEWTEAEVTDALDAIVLHATDFSAKAGEIRIREDALGLTDKGLKVRRRLMPPGTDTPELTPVPAPTPIRPMPEAK